VISEVELFRNALVRERYLRAKAAEQGSHLEAAGV
jgi:hypothetical protein